MAALRGVDYPEDVVRVDECDVPYLLERDLVHRLDVDRARLRLLLREHLRVPQVRLRDEAPARAVDQEPSERFKMACDVYFHHDDSPHRDTPHPEPLIFEYRVNRISTPRSLA